MKTQDHIDTSAGARAGERGSALLTAMMVLALMTILALGSLSTVMRDRQVAGYQKRARTALYAAEAGVALAAGILRSAPPSTDGGVGQLQAYAPTFPAAGGTEQQIGSGPNRPEFYADNGHPGIKFLSTGRKCWEGNAAGAMSDNLGARTPIWRDVLWDVRVKGEAADQNTTKVVQALVTSCHPFN